jgi:vancomycin resistance protein VanJ
VNADAQNRFLVRCDLGQHRVVLDPARFWRPVRCPGCRAPMDQYRIRRIALWLTGRAPRSAVRFGNRLRLVPIEGIALLVAIVVVIVSLLLHTVADDWWPATVLLFLGRWPWVLPVVPTLLLALVLRAHRAALIAASAGAIGLFLIMQLSLGLGRFFGRSDDTTAVRVVTFNIGGDLPAPLQLVELVAQWEPDVVAIQDCGEVSRDQLRKIPNYFSDLGSTCLLSRFPIVRMDSLRRDRFMAAGGAAWVKRYRLKGRGGEFDLTNVHLDTPRRGFESLLAGGSNATSVIDDKTAVRELESRLARRWVDLGPGPRLVAGDFNMPTESAIFRSHWGTLTDGFEHAGVGFGYSRLAGWIQLRIDHILADDNWVVKSAQVLPDYGSDHLPVMVDVELRRH